MPTIEHEHVCEEDLELYPTEFLPNGKDSVIEAYLGEHESCVVKLSTAGNFLRKRDRLSAKQLQDKRRDHRFITNDSAVLQIMNPLLDAISDVRIRDVSKNGLRLHVASGVMVGSAVKVRMKDYIAFGVVRYCIPSTEGFFVGVQVHECIARKSIQVDMRDKCWPAMPEDHSPSATDGYVAAGWRL
jgi:hypothetical protein